jgi:membrane protease YdiL (CAAX protease family)
VSLKEGLRIESHALWLAAALTAIVAIESIYLPTAPFFIIYGILAIIIPITVRDFRFGRLTDSFRGHWRVVAAVFAIALFSDVLFIGVIWDGIVQTIGHSGSAFWSLTAAIDALLSKSGTRLGIGKDGAQALFAAYFLLWAPIAEELFYRGYLFQSLRANRGFKAAALISAAFFGIRHATHLLILLPAFPLVAALVWVADAFVIGLAYAYLYEKTESLWPSFLVHFAINLIGMVLSALMA